MKSQLHIAMELSIYQETTKTVSETNSQTRLQLILRKSKMSIKFSSYSSKYIITVIIITVFDCNKNHKKAMYLPTLVVNIFNHPVRKYNIPFTIVHSSVVLILIANCFFEA